MALTDLAIRSAKPTNALQKISDGEGLQLWVQPNGSKLWRMAYRFAGKQKTLAIGTYPAIGLSDARKKRDEAKALLASGVDPSQQKRLDKVAKAISNATTFRVIAEEYLDKQRREGRSETTIVKNRYLLEQAFPAIGERPVAEIKAAEVLAILKHLEKRGTLETAKRVRATIGAVIRYAIATARAESDPTTALSGAIIARKNVKGGVSQIHEYDDAPPVYGVTLMPGDALVVDDREVFHMVTPLIAEEGEGHRDMILMGFHMWSHGKYRGDWKQQIDERN
ncbi:MAG: integrase arm-type DNA-binding domain-containing protein [Methylobacterium sp.]|nr:integrase arm-type DNA-binding domain-containing protein [Methylobacterium sp.]MCA3653217.1 integrase arm-type DNA-binding domain-containing protein [Methylobacterium sp.]